MAKPGVVRLARFLESRTASSQLPVRASNYCLSPREAGSKPNLPRGQGRIRSKPLNSQKSHDLRLDWIELCRQAHRTDPIYRGLWPS